MSYGFSAAAQPGGLSLASDKITNPSLFVLFAPAQTADSTVKFQGVAGSAAPGVTVSGVGSNKATSTPGGTATKGTHSSRTRIDVCMADLHVENMPWTTFTNNSNSSSDPCAIQRWKPIAICP